jgi:hypothetical protein
LFLASAFAFLLAWILPHHFLPWTAFYSESLAAAALLLLASAIFLRSTAARNICIPKTSVILLLVALIPLFQLGCGQITFRGDAWMASLYLLGLLLAYLTGYHTETLRLTRSVAHAMAGLILLGALISVFLAVHQWLRSDNLGIWLLGVAPGGRPYANLAQPNNLATLFCLGIASVIYLRICGIFGTFVSALMALLLFAGIAITMSRAPFLILAVVVAWIWWNRTNLKFNLSSTQIVSGLVLFLACWWLWPTISDKLLLTGHYENSAMMVERMRTDLRPVIWTQLLDAAMRAPFAGYGWNQVAVAQISVAAEYPQSVMVEHSHNIVLDMLIWNGLLIGSVLVLMVAWWVFSRLKRCPNEESWFAMLAILVVGVHGLLEYPLEYTYFLFPLGLFAGIADKSYSASCVAMPRSSMYGILLIGWLALGLVFGEYIKAEDDFRHMRFESIGIEAKTAANETPGLLLLTQIQEYTRFARTEARGNMATFEIEWMRDVAHRYPHPPAMFRYALALGLNHRYEEASLELKRLQQLHPPVHSKQARKDWKIMTSQYPVLANVHWP